MKSENMLSGQAIYVGVHMEKEDAQLLWNIMKDKGLTNRSETIRNLIRQYGTIPQEKMIEQIIEKTVKKTLKLQTKQENKSNWDAI